jgi:hypothetical protein
MAKLFLITFPVFMIPPLLLNIVAIEFLMWAPLMSYQLLIVTIADTLPYRSKTSYLKA